MSYVLPTNHVELRNHHMCRQQICTAMATILIVFILVAGCLCFLYFLFVVILK